MDPSGIVQTVDAAFGCASVAYNLYIFLRRAQNADKTAADGAEKIKQAHDVLNHIGKILDDRRDEMLSSDEDTYEAVLKTISETIEACNKIFNRIKSKLGVLDESQAGTSMVTRIRVAYNHNALGRLNGDLEAIVNILQTSLTVLLLHDSFSVKSDISAIRNCFIELESQIATGHKIRQALATPHSPQSSRLDEKTARSHSEAEIFNEKLSEETLSRLDQWLPTVKKIHGRYSSQYDPDWRSEADRERSREIEDETKRESVGNVPSTPPPDPDEPNIPSPIDATPAPGTPQLEEDNEFEQSEYQLPPEVLTEYVRSYREHALRDQEAEKFNQAEFHLNQAAKYSTLRSKVYNIPFDDKIKLHEDLVYVLQKQQKWAEAIKTIHAVFSGTGGSTEAKDDCAQALQYQLLASTYFDRHKCNAEGNLNQSTSRTDIESAQKNAQDAFSIRYNSQELLQNLNETERQRTTIQLIVDILNARDKPLEAQVFERMLGTAIPGHVSSPRPSRNSNYIRPESSSSSEGSPSQENGFVEVDDGFMLMLEAVKSGDTNQLQTVLSNDDSLNLEQTGSHGKTALMHAVEREDKDMVHRLLALGADVNTQNRKGYTALHLAAQLGSCKMIGYLIRKDANLESKDREKETPLVKAVQEGHLDAARMLIERKADIQTRNGEDCSLLHLAVRLDSPHKMITLLLDERPELKESLDSYDRTALHHCAEKARLDAARALLERNDHPDINAVDCTHRTALHFVASRPRTDNRAAFVRMLLNHGAVIDPQDLPTRYQDYEELRAQQQRQRPGMQMGRKPSAASSEQSTNTTGSMKIKLMKALTFGHK